MHPSIGEAQGRLEAGHPDNTELGARRSTQPADEERGSINTEWYPDVFGLPGRPDRCIWMERLLRDAPQNNAMAIAEQARGQRIMRRRDTYPLDLHERQNVVGGGRAEDRLLHHDTTEGIKVIRPCSFRVPAGSRPQHISCQQTWELQAQPGRLVTEIKLQAAQTALDCIIAVDQCANDWQKGRWRARTALLLPSHRMVAQHDV